MDERKEYVESESDDSFINIDFRKLLADVVRYWWVFLITIAIAVTAVKLYHRYHTPVYRSSMTIIIDESGNGSSSSAQSNLMEGFALSSGMRNLENQVAILGSYALVRQTVEQMNLLVSYYNKGRIHDVQMYRPGNFVVVMDSTHAQLIGTKIHFDCIDEDSFRLYFETENPVFYDYKNETSVSVKIDDDDSDRKLAFSGRFRYGEPIVTDWGAFAIVKNPNVKMLSGSYYFVFNRLDAIVAGFMSSYSVGYNGSSSSSLVTLSVTGTIPERNNDFLNILSKTFLQRNLQQKNQIADNTIAFITEQLSFLSDSLLNVGTQLSAYKISNDLQLGASEKGRAIFDEMKRYESEVQEQEVTKAYYKYLRSYFSNDQVFDSVIAPASYNTQSTILSQQLSSIIELNSERLSYQESYGKASNPVSVEMNSKLQIARNTLLHSIDSHIEMTDQNISEIKARLSDLNEELSKLPETERIMLSLDRKFTLNNEVFNYLLRKRSESQIQKASNTSDHKILDAPMNRGVISSSASKHLLTAVALAIILPLLFFVLRQILDTRIRTIEDLKNKVRLPFLGSLLSNEKDSSLVVLRYPKSVQSEGFRQLRTKIQFMISQCNETPVVAVSSSVSGEGKTYTSFNIATAFALNGKRTLLLGFDLRRPGLAKMIGGDHPIGLADYIADNRSIDEVTVQITKNLYVIPGGTIPPNPSELIDSERTTELFETIKMEYDIIFVDTPPMGIVTDGFQLLRKSDALVFVVRQDYTEKDVLSYTLEQLKGEDFKNVGIVLNDVNGTRSRYKYSHYGYKNYGYGKVYGKYGYGYGYGYGYYSE